MACSSCPKAMPVILTTPSEVDLWLSADASKALELQRPLPDDVLRIVASGEKEDGPREAVPYQDQDQCFRFDCVGRLRPTKMPVFGWNAQRPFIRRRPRWTISLARDADASRGFLLSNATSLLAFPSKRPVFRAAVVEDFSISSRLHVIATAVNCNKAFS
jgi:hypothetical protein